MTEPSGELPEIVIDDRLRWQIVMAFILGAIAVAIAVELMHRSLPEHHAEE